MSTKDQQLKLVDTNFEDFATSLLPLYSGPQISIRIGSESREYVLPKALLCKQSPYFAAMFEGSFEESENRSAILEEIDGVVSPRSFQMLAQWLLLGQVVWNKLAPEEAITASIEFVRLADMCSVTGMETLIAEHIKGVINNSTSSTQPSSRGPFTDIHCISSQHIISATFLPDGHPVRRMIAKACVEGFLCHKNFKFSEEAERPNFAIDLLREVKESLDTLTSLTHSQQTFKEPLSGSEVRLERVPSQITSQVSKFGGRRR